MNNLNKILRGILSKIRHNTFFLNSLIYFLYWIGFVNYLLCKLFKVPYIGFYLFSNQDNFRGRVEVLKKILNFKCKTSTKLNILEIGTYCGQNILEISKILKKNNLYFSITSVDPYNLKKLKVSKRERERGGGLREKLFLSGLQRGKCENLFNMNIKYLKIEEYIQKFKLFSYQFYKRNKKKFDLIIIDGSHLYKDVKSDIDNCKNLLNENGILIIDDYEISSATKLNLDLNKFKNFDTIPGFKDYYFHPGVTLAVKNSFKIKPLSLSGVACIFKKKKSYFDFFKTHKKILN